MKLLLDFVFVTGISLIVLIIVVLTKSSNRPLSKRTLIVFFSFALSVAFFSYASLHHQIWLMRLTFIPNDITVLVIGPLLFLYVKSLFVEDANLVRQTLKHFIPAALSLVFIAIPTLIYDMFKLEALSYVVSGFVVNFIKLDYVYLILYLVLSLRLLSRYRNAVKDNYSNLSKFDFTWIKTMLLGTFSIIVAYLLISIYELLFEDFVWYQEYLVTVVMILLIGYLGYYGVNQSKVLVPDFLVSQKTKGTNAKENKPSLSQIKEFEKLKQDLEYVLVRKKPYLDEELTLGKLAEELSITDKKLSILLNTHMHTSFFDLINKYRVKAVEERIQIGVDEKYTLFGIASECGFKSRTSFNRIFKRETGFSPSAYKNRHL